MRNRFIAGAAAAIAALSAVAIQATASAAPATASATRTPAGFKAVSTTWLSGRRGWILGTATCGTKTCTYVITTGDAGRSWQVAGKVPAPVPVNYAPTHGVTEVRFATPRIGWAFAPSLYRTSDGGRTWTREANPGHAKQVLNLAVNGTAAYAVTSPCVPGTGICGTKSLHVWRTANGRTWIRTPIAPPINIGADVTAAGRNVYVADANVASSYFYVSVNRGKTFARRDVPCQTAQGQLLTQVVPVSATKIALLCNGPSDGPPGSSNKAVFWSTDAGQTYRSAGSLDNSLGTQSILAASRTGNLAIASTGGAAFMYINDSKSTSWQALTVSTDPQGWGDFSYVSGTEAWVIYSPAEYFGALGEVYVTRDAGRHWAKAKL